MIFVFDVRLFAEWMTALQFMLVDIVIYIIYCKTLTNLFSKTAELI